MPSSTFPPAPTNTIDWENIGFRTREVNGHIESHYSAKTGKWTEPEFVEDPFIRVHGLAPGLNYGQQCYEGLKAFRDPNENINIFRPVQNAERMQHSASYISIPKLPTEHFLKCVHLAVGKNAEFVPPHSTGASLYIRPLLYGSGAQLPLNPCEDYTFLVYVLPVGVYHGIHPVAALILEDFDRAAPEGVGSAKVGGNYAPVLRWSEKAKEEGFGITLHLDSKTRSSIDEFSTSGFLGAKRVGDSITLVVPNSTSAIKSVTSTSVREIAASLGWKVEYREVKYEELSAFDEVMAAGTAAALVPIKSITMRSTGDTFEYKGMDGNAGEVVSKLLTTLKGIQVGKIEDTFGWLQRVEEPKGYSETNGHTNGTADGENVNQLQ